VPGILGAVSLGTRPVLDLPFARVLGRLRRQPRVHTALHAAADGRAAFGVVDLGVFTGSGSAWTASAAGASSRARPHRRR
jgi:hypothetical protein